MNYTLNADFPDLVGRNYPFSQLVLCFVIDIWRTVAVGIISCLARSRVNLEF